MVKTFDQRLEIRPACGAYWVRTPSPESIAYAGRTSLVHQVYVSQRAEGVVGLVYLGYVLIGLGPLTSMDHLWTLGKA